MVLFGPGFQQIPANSVLSGFFFPGSRATFGRWGRRFGVRPGFRRPPGWTVRFQTVSGIGPGFPRKARVGRVISFQKRARVPIGGWVPHNTVRGLRFAEQGGFQRGLIPWDLGPFWGFSREFGPKGIGVRLKGVTPKGVYLEEEGRFFPLGTKKATTARFKKNARKCCV